jgi:uncharacterized protein (TIGR03437 family)
MSSETKIEKKPFLVRAFAVVIWGLLFGTSLQVGYAQFPISADTTTFGEVIALPGHINELILDEARGQMYAGNFSAGRVEVVSMTSNQRIGSFLSDSSPSALSAMAMSADGHYLVVTNVPVTPDPAALSGITVINLNDPADRRHYTMAEQPLALAFAINGEALVITTTKLQIFDPVDGSLRDIFELEGSPDPVVVPVPFPTLPRELTAANATSSRDYRYIYGSTNAFVFSYDIAGRLGFLTIRPNDSLVAAPLFQQVSAADDGSYFLAGQLLFDNRMTVMADSPAAPDTTSGLFGGHVIDSEIETVYASFDDPAELGGGRQPGAFLLLMDADNLFVRKRIRIAEQIQGRLALTADGNRLYGVSESGLTYFPLHSISETPQIDVRAEDRQLLFEFNFCNQEPQTRTLRLETNDGAPAEFFLTATRADGTIATGINFEPHQGVAPADVRVTVSSAAVGALEGSAEFKINIVTDAANIPQPASIFASVRDLDQKGIFHEFSGQFVDIVGDPNRDRFYVLDQQRFMVHMFDSDSFRLLGSFRTGNTPTWMTLNHDGSMLVVANSRGETLSFIDLNNLRKFGEVRLPWRNLLEGLYPNSVAQDNSGILIAARAPAGGRITTFRLNEFRTPETLGIFLNAIDPASALLAMRDRSGVLIASSDGRTAFWEALTRQVILARNDFGSLSGPVGTGDDFFVIDNHLLNSSLVPQRDFADGDLGQEAAGFVMLPDGTGVRTLSPLSEVGTGLIMRFDPDDPGRVISPIRMVEPARSNSEVFPFVRTLAVMRNGKLASFGTAGLLEFPADYDAANRNPRITAIVNSANFKTDVASGGLVSIFGENLAEADATASGTPLPLSLGGACVTANGLSLPLLYVSDNQINAQMSFNVGGAIAAIVRTNSGISDIFLTNVQSAAPAVFNVQGPNEDLFAAVFRLENNLLATLSNPIRRNEVAIAFTTGIGSVTPLLLDGNAAPSSPLAITNVQPTVTVGNAAAQVLFSGLAPGFVGLYQINFLVPWGAPLGLQVPITISAGAVTETFFVRVIDPE